MMKYEIGRKVLNIDRSAAVMQYVMFNGKGAGREKKI